MAELIREAGTEDEPLVTSARRRAAQDATQADCATGLANFLRAEGVEVEDYRAWLRRGGPRD